MKDVYNRADAKNKDAKFVPSPQSKVKNKLNFESAGTPRKEFKEIVNSQKKDLELLPSTLKADFPKVIVEAGRDSQEFVRAPVK